MISPYKTFSPINKADTESSVNIDVSAFAIIVETLNTSTFPSDEELPF
jgi:hypothetical protein